MAQLGEMVAQLCLGAEIPEGVAQTGLLEKAVHDLPSRRVAKRIEDGAKGGWILDVGIGRLCHMSKV